MDLESPLVRGLVDILGRVSSPEERSHIGRLIAGVKLMQSQLVQKGTEVDGNPDAVALTGRELLGGMSAIDDDIDQIQQKPRLGVLVALLQEFIDKIDRIINEIEEAMAQQKNKGSMRDLAKGLSESCERKRAAGHLEEVGNDYYWLGSLYDDLGMHISAIRSHRAAFRIVEQTKGREDDLARNLHMMGAGYRQLMRPTVAVDYLTRSIKIWERLNNDEQAEAMCYAELGECYEQLGELVEAERCFMVAEERFAKDPEAADLKRMCRAELMKVRRRMGRHY